MQVVQNNDLNNLSVIITRLFCISSECCNNNWRVLYSQDGRYSEVRGKFLQEDRVFFCSQVSRDPNIGTATLAAVLIRDRNSDVSVGFTFHTFTTTDYLIWTVLTHFWQICNAQIKLTQDKMDSWGVMDKINILSLWSFFFSLDRSFISKAIYHKMFLICLAIDPLTHHRHVY